MTTLRLTLIMLSVLAFCKDSLAQGRLLRKSWIKTSIEEFRRHPGEPDTLYLRYVFRTDVVVVGFEPGWHDMQIPYAIDGNILTLGFDQWKIETLTDSTLTIFLSGFRRIKFVAEAHLRARDRTQPVQVGEYNGKPLYRANRLVTPRYKEPNPLMDDIKKQDRSDHYNIHKAGTFLMTFIVTDKGEIEEPKIVKSVADGFDKGIMKELLKTSKRWSPAIYKEQSVQTLMTFEIRFLDSLTDY